MAHTPWLARPRSDDPSLANHPHSHPNPFYQKPPSSTLAHHTPSHPLNLTKLPKRQTSNQGKIPSYLRSFHLVHFAYLPSLTIIIQICAHYHTPTSPYHHHHHHFLSVTVTTTLLWFPVLLCEGTHGNAFGRFRFLERGICGCATFGISHLRLSSQFHI